MATGQGRKYGRAFKAEVALEAIRGKQTLDELAERFQVPPDKIVEWEKHLTERAEDVFTGYDRTEEEQPPSTYDGKIKWQYHALALTLCLLFFLFRLTDLGTNPKGFFCDEASIAFNAKSILQTGRDEHGVLFPVFFKAFGDYKSSPYIYATALSIALFGNSQFAARLPAAAFLGLSIFAVYLLLSKVVHPSCGLLSIAVLGTEPWLNHFSHIAFELSAVPLFLCLAVLFWVYAVRGRPLYFYLSTLFFILSFYAYPTARLFVPLFFAGITAIYRAEIFGEAKNRQHFFISLIVAALASLPFFYYLFFKPDFLGRVKYLSLFTTPFLNYSHAYKWLEETLKSWHLSITDIHSKGLLKFLLFIVNYVAYYSPRYLFFHGDYNLRFGNPEFGIMSYVSIIGIATGLLTILLRRTKFDKLLILWLLIFAIPAALTWEDIPHSGRGIVGHPGLDMIAVIGLWETGRYLLSHNRTKKYLFVPYVSLCLFLYGYHATKYFTYYRNDYSIQASGWMQYGFRQMMEYVRDNYRRYKRVVLVSTGLHYQAYIFALYYSNTSPEKWRTQRKLPWNLEIWKHPLGRKDYHKNVLYIFAPVPPNLDPHFRLLRNVTWEDRTGIAFAYYIYDD